ncbi:MAG: hypothetical protein ACLFVJ_08605 [Persicimonas sp.]
MNNFELLSIYLQDHHATSTGALELVRRMIESNSDNIFGQKVEYVAGELIESRGQLEQVMDVLEVNPSRVKEAGMWLGEKLGRLKLNGQVVGYSPLSRMIEFEGLCMALNGQVRLWESLKIVADSDQRLASFDFDGLSEQAREQLERVEAMHRLAVEAAFVEPPQH